MDHILRLADQESELLTRAQGQRIRESIARRLDTLAQGDRLIIEFTDVHVMTPSFADECLGKLAGRLGPDRFRKLIRLTHASETNRILVNAVLSDRLSTAKA